MIDNKNIASEVSNLMLQFGARLDESVARVEAECSATEFKSYRTAIGKVLGEMLFEVMNPIYLRHPDLKPKELS